MIESEGRSRSALRLSEPLSSDIRRRSKTNAKALRLSCPRNQRCTSGQWEPYRQSIEQWMPDCRIVYDKFHVMQHANHAVDEVRRAEFFRKGGRIRGLVKGKRWLLLTRWVNLTAGKRRQLNELFTLNRRLLKGYLLKESLDRLREYRYEEPWCGTSKHGWTNSVGSACYRFRSSQRCCWITSTAS